VLALQGAFAAHEKALSETGATLVQVRQVRHLDGLDALVLPGGESTTMSNLLIRFELFDPIDALLAEGMPALGTCAGSILLASGVSGGRADQRSFGRLGIEVARNGYGRQIASFEAPLDVTGLDGPFHGVFIRAPIITRIEPDVEVLASYQDNPVIVRSGNVIATTFHPELSGDNRLHQMFVDLVGLGHLQNS
jgi:5'-phosphate synthase pdxT subunit